MLWALQKTDHEKEMCTKCQIELQNLSHMNSEGNSFNLWNIFVLLLIKKLEPIRLYRLFLKVSTRDLKYKNDLALVR